MRENWAAFVAAGSGKLVALTDAAMEQEQLFRNASPGGSVGWELMDDHVHPTLRGQALMAETFVNTLGNLTGKAQLPSRRSRQDCAEGRLRPPPRRQSV